MLYIVATPIGNWGDITDRARQILKECDFIIGEEFRNTSTFLKKIGLAGTTERQNALEKRIYLLNEHSKQNEIKELGDLCATNTVALISDCGTPGFADPGPALIKLCRARNIRVTALPGASSLTTLISLTSEPIRTFVFFGFLPREANEREQALTGLATESRAWVVMDTPYRLKPLLEQLAKKLPHERALLGLDLTQESEQAFEGTIIEICKKVEQQKIEKAEFMLLKYSRPV